MVTAVAKDEFAGCGGRQWGADAFFTAEHRTMLEGLMYPKKAEAGAHLFWEGDEPGKLYYVRSGRIKLVKTTEEGRTINLTFSARAN